jgi:cytochrome c-type biogenesis protein CcmH/NrfG
VEAAPQVSQEAPPETIEEGLDWLDKLSETRGIDADIEREPAAGTISGRLASERPQEASQPEPEPPAPDDSSLWEPEIPGQTAEPAGLDSGEYEPAAAEPVSDEEVPTWLLAGAEEPDQPAESLDEFAAEPEEDVPSWLLDQGEQFEAEPTMEQPTAPAPTEAPPASSMETEPEADDEVPAWLYATEDEESEPEAPAAEAAEATPAPPPPAQQPPAAEEAEEVPDWLKSQVQAESTQAEPASQPVEPPTPVEPAEPEPAAQAVEPPTPAEPAEPEPTLPAIEQPTPLEPAEAEPAPQPVQPPTPVESAEAAPAPQAAEQPSTVEPVEPEPTAEVEPEVEPAETTAAQEVVEAAAEPAESQPAAAEQPTPVQPATAEQPPAPTEAPEPEPAAALPAATEDPLAAARQALAQNDDQKAAADLSARVKDRSHLEEIVRLLEGHLEQEPDSPLLWQVLGDAYMRQNRTEQAVRAYDRGMEESEVFDSARQALAAADFERATAQYGMLIKNKKRLDTVIEDLEQAVEGDQSDPRIWQILGDAYMKADRLDESIEAYRKGMDSV